MAGKQKQRSLGEMISTVCFYGVGAYFLLDGSQARGEKRRVKPIGKLLDTSKRGASVNNGRSSLKDPNLGLPVHHLHHGPNSVTGEEAIGVQNDHILILTSPAPQEISHVAAFVVEINPTPAIEEPTVSAELFHQFQPDLLFLQPDIRILTV